MTTQTRAGTPGGCSRMRDDGFLLKPNTRWIIVAVVLTVAIILIIHCLSGFSGSTSMRLLGLLICLAVAAALLLLPLFHPVALEQVFYFTGAVIFLLYFLVSQAVLLSPVVGSGDVHKAIHGGVNGISGIGSSVVWNTYRAVHVTIGLVIMVPILVLAFFPFMTHFQTRMLFNQNFSARFTSAKMFAVERERQKARGWFTRESGRGGGEKRAASPPPTISGEGNGRSSAPPPQPSASQRAKFS